MARSITRLAIYGPHHFIGRLRPYTPGDRIMTSHSRQGDVYDVRGYICGETENAICVDMDDGEKVWFPLSQVEEIHRENGPNKDWLVVTKWIAQKKGLA